MFFVVQIAEMKKKNESRVWYLLRDMVYDDDEYKGNVRGEITRIRALLLLGNDPLVRIMLVRFSFLSSYIQMHIL